MLKPIPPLPDHLRGNETGTFTEDSVVRRLPEIALRTIDDNDLEGHYRQRVEQLAVEIGQGVVTHLEEPEAPDYLEWQGYVDLYEGLAWVDAPWFFVETYFYRRLLAATGYSQPGPRRGVDPFTRQKHTALEGALGLAGRLGVYLTDVEALLGASLWANRVDLSLWRAGERDIDTRTAEVLAGPESRLLIDGTAPALELLGADAVDLHLVLDNSGAELVADLALVAGILRRGGRATIHAKPHPTFVSDVTLPDLEATIDRLAVEETAATEIARELNAARDRGALLAHAHPFWVSPLPFWECPADLVDELAGADVVVVKGDANYRRLLGDLHWHATTPFTDIVRPRQPLLALRTPKSLVAAGVAPEVVERASAIDPDWLSDGEWGMIVLAPAVDPSR